MSYIPKTCPLCGANLDPGESCDCQEAVISVRGKAYFLDENMRLEPTFMVGENGQMALMGVDLASGHDFLSKKFNISEKDLETSNNAGEQ